MNSDTNQQRLLALGQAIAKQRKCLGLTQSELAEKLEMSNDAVSRIERGNIVPSALRLFELADVLQCDAADLLALGGGSREVALRVEKLLARIDEEKRIRLLYWLEQMVEMLESK